MMEPGIGLQPGGIEWRCSTAPVPYETAVDAMERRAAAIRERHAPELVWLLEHPALYTAGTSARAEDLLEPGRLPVYKSGRGGQYTYHGPGQRIAYVLLDLDRRGRPGHRDVRCHVRRLEEWIIATLASFNVTGERRERRVGVWVAGPDGREDKIAAIGVRVRRWVTYHGVALNLDPDLDQYRGIIPCGIAPEISGHGVISLARLGVTASMAEIDTALRATFDRVFERVSVKPLSRTAGEGAEHREAGEGADAERPSPSHRSATGPSLSRDAGEG